MKLGYKDMLKAAEADVRMISTEEGALLKDEDGVVFVDIRDIRELDRDGMIPDARHAPRGMLEFWIDPTSPYHKPYFAEDKMFVFYCASGWRSLLAAQTANAMGLNCASLTGGFSAWRKEGRPTADRDSQF